MPDPIAELVDKLMTAADIRDRLHSRWPDDAHIHINEAPMTSGRNSGRKLDVLVMCVLKSRKFERHGIEIKVSMGDFRTEIRNADKADWWWNHVNYFWIAAPLELTAKMRPLLPEGWGLIGVTATNTRLVVQAERHDAEPFTDDENIGLLRAAADAGPLALKRAHLKGVEEGKESRAPTGLTPAQQEAIRDYPYLRETVDHFEEASGVSIGNRWDGARIGAAVKIVMSAGSDPDQIATLFDNYATHVDLQTANLRTAAAKLRKLNTGSTELPFDDG